MGALTVFAVASYCVPALATVVFRFIDTAETGDMSVGRVDVYRTGKIELAENTSGLNGRNAIARKRQNELAGADPPDEEPGYPHDRTA